MELRKEEDSNKEGQRSNVRERQVKNNNSSKPPGTFLLLLYSVAVTVVALDAIGPPMRAPQISGVRRAERARLCEQHRVINTELPH